MPDFTYSANGGGVRQFHDNPGLHYNLTDAYANANANANAHSLELMFQEHINSDQLSPIMHHPAARPSISEQQAVSQPYATSFIASHIGGNGYLQRSMPMRRSASSSHSLNSSGYQTNSGLQRQSRRSFGNASPPYAEMPRAVSRYSHAPTHQAAPQPNATQPHLDTSNYYPSTLPPSSSPAIPQYDPISATGTSDSILDFGVTEILGRHSVEAEQESEVFGRTTTSNGDFNYLAAYSQPPRPRLDSFVQLTSQERLNVLCSPRSDAPADHRALPSPVPHDSPTLSPPQVRRRRRISPAQANRPDPIIGQTTLSGKFKCVDATCDDLTFGRQADFRRHYENVHSPNRLEYFCPVNGCSRSQHPQGGRSKGRSFNNRKDKMEEHVRTVHSLDESEGSEVKTKGKRSRTKY